MNNGSLEDSFNNLTYIESIKDKKYKYFVHPLCDGTSPITTRYLNEFVEWAKPIILNQYKKNPFNYILTAEAMGIPLATVLSYELGIPFLIARKRRYGLPKEISVEKTTGYSKEFLYINGLFLGDRVLFLDDVLDTGGTLKAIYESLRQHDINIVCGIFLVRKESSPSDFDFPIHAFKTLK